MKPPVQLHETVGGDAHCVATNPAVPKKLPEIVTPLADVAIKLFEIAAPSEPNPDQLVESFAPVPSHNDRKPAPAVPVVSKTKTAKTHSLEEHARYPNIDPPLHEFACEEHDAGFCRRRSQPPP